MARNPNYPVDPSGYGSRGQRPTLPSVRELFPDLPETRAAEERRQSRQGTPVYQSPLRTQNPAHGQLDPSVRRPITSAPTQQQPPSALFQVLAPGPSGLNTLQADTNRPIGIYRQDRRTHEATAENERTRRYVCDDCSAAFSRPSELRTHAHRHTGSKPFSCSICHKDFSTSSNLLRHMRQQHDIEGTSGATNYANSSHHESRSASASGGSEPGN